MFCSLVIWDSDTLTCFDKILVSVLVVYVLTAYTNESTAAV